MLDESLCGFPDAQAALTRRTADLFNVRLSKCGGVLPSLRIIGLCSALGSAFSSAAIPARPRAAFRGGASCRQPRRGSALRRGLL